MTDDPNALRRGVSIAGYNIVRVIGAGGFGITYEADSPFTGKRVAIKEFFPRGIASRRENGALAYAERDRELVQWALKRFESSTLDQCKLDHPNIVDVIHYVKDNDTGYMIMEYVEGDTLEQWLRAGNAPAAPEELQPLLSPAFSALEYLHAHNMIHRDIAPDNIMIRADGSPVIIDFGAIKLIGQETQRRSDTRSFTVMKQFYSPPEQIQAGGEVDHRADIYSLGAVLYRAFADMPPASAEERMQKRAFGKEDPYVPLAERAEHLSPDVSDAVDRSLAFDVEDRHPDVEELRRALGWQHVDETIVLPRALLRNDDEAPKRSRLPWMLPLIGILFVSLGAVYFGGLISLPRFGGEVVQAPTQAPKLDGMKEIQQAPVHTQPEPNTTAQDHVDGYMVVIASHRTEQEAQAALDKLKVQLPSLFEDQTAEVVMLDLGDQGKVYRAMVGPLIKEEADALCQEFKRNSVVCLVRMDN